LTIADRRALSLAADDVAGLFMAMSLTGIPLGEVRSATEP
jgi:hypothetical protein